MTTTAMGEEGFRWFVGIVENVTDDPLQLGRVKVRILNEYDEGIETGDMEWCQMMMPNTSECVNGVGDTPGLAVGSNVVGFFLDGEEKQLAMILGSFPVITGMDKAKHSIPPLARGENSIVKDAIGPEPASSYAAQYPYNRVISTKSGHAIEIDDSPGAERIHIYHKSGTYIEINSDGRFVLKSINDAFEIVQQNKTLYVSGDVNMEVKGTVNLTAPITNIKGDVNVTGTITASDDVIGGGKSLKSHKHSGVQSGASTTGAPI